MAFHHGQVHGVARGETLIGKDNLFCALDDRSVNRENLVHCVQECVKGRLDVVASINCDVSVQDFLQHFCVGD
jgi:hypothetical protein